MLNVGTIQEGFVLDHIQAGKSMDIYKYLHLDNLDCCVAIIKNAKSNKMGRKDIIKIGITGSRVLFGIVNLDFFKKFSDSLFVVRICKKRSNRITLYLFA